MTAPTSVYWLMNSYGRVLYVGCSTKPEWRVTAHRKKPWGSEIAHVTIATFPTRTMALQVELSEIQRLDPQHNVMFTTRDNNSQSEYIAKGRQRATELAESAPTQRVSR